MKEYRRRFFRPGRDEAARDRELDEEIRSHLEMRVDDLVAAGMSREEAESEARRRFGDPDQARTRLARSSRRRDARLGAAAFLDGLAMDLRLALRELRRSGGGAFLEWTTLAVGVGLATLAFTLVDRVLLRPLPFPEPSSLVALYSVPESGLGDAFPWVSSENWLDWRDGNRTLAATALHFYENARGAVLLDGGAEPFPVASVTAGFFDVLRPDFVRGRGFVEEDGAEGRPVAVVSESFWRNVLGAPETLAGRTVTLDGTARDVVGVVDDDQVYPEDAAIWTPRTVPRRGDGTRNNINFLAVARLRPGVTAEQARADLSSIARGIRERAPEARYSWGVDVRPMRELVVDRGVETQLYLVMGGVLVLLLAGAVNLSGLGLVRAADRLDETAVRMALGSGRWRIVRARLVRQAVVAVSGAAGGLVVAWVGLVLVRRTLADALPRSGELALDGRVAVVGVATALLAGLLAGVYPALRSASVSLRGAITGGGDGLGSGGRVSGRFLVATQIALASVLLVGSALTVRSLLELTGRELGYEPDGVLSAEVVLTPQEYDDPAVATDFWRRSADAVGALPGVRAASLTNAPPMADGGTGFTEVEGRPDAGSGAAFRVVRGDYFGVAGIPLVEGRIFGAGADAEEGVVVINRAMAASHWPGENPLGKRVRALSMESVDGRPAPWRTVIGVVGDIRHGGFLSEPRAEMYVPFGDGPEWQLRRMFVVGRVGAGEIGSTAASVGEVLRESDPRLVPEVTVLAERLRAGVSRQRLLAAVLTLFGAMAVLVAALGVYGLLSFVVRRRTREMGIRAALGAERGALVRMVVRDAMVVAGLGMVAGLAVAWAGRSVLASQVVDVSTLDPVSFGVAAVVPLALAFVAALVPAARAARVDPVVALREG